MSTTKSISQNNSLEVSIKYFIYWRVLLFLIAFVAIKFMPLQDNFLGGGSQLYTGNPLFWGWINFDGEHYLSIARDGYKPLTHFYFPVYPIIISAIAAFTSKTTTIYAIIGILVSNLFAFLSIFGLHKLISLDNKGIANKSILLLLIFPTSFYLVGYYTESLFLALSVWSFYFARKKSYYKSALLISIATATRVIGFVLAISLFMEIYRKYRLKKLLKYFPLLITPIGIFSYMNYLKITTGDPLEFFNTVEIFGEQRSSSLVMLPQVYYRYIFKILPNLNGYMPAVFTTLLEIGLTTIFLTLIAVGYKHMRKSYWLFLALGFIVPTFAGSFSSMPRYLLVLFPAFMLMSAYFKKHGTIERVYVVISVVLLAISTSMFLRGYWIS